MKSYEEAYKELEQDKSVKEFCENIRAAEEAIRIAGNMYARDEVTNNAVALAIRDMQERGDWDNEVPVTAEEIVRRQDWIADHLNDDPDEIIDAVFGSFYLLSYGEVPTTAHSYIVDNAAEIADAYHELFGD